MNKKIRILFLWASAFVFCGCASIVGALVSKNVLPNKDVRPGTFQATQKKLAMTTRDGVELVSTVFLPEGIHKAPTLLVRIPYSRNFTNQVRTEVIGKFWAKRGYAVVIQGTRGRYESGGDFYPLINEREDGIQTLDWLKTQDWFDGRLVMWGGSSFGHTQWAISDQADNGPDAYFIQIASSSFREMFYPGGAFAFESALFWAIRSAGEKDREVTPEMLIKGLGAPNVLVADDSAIGDVDFYNGWIRNKGNDGFWESVDGKNKVDSVKSPMLLMGGWQDPFLAGQLKDFQALQQSPFPGVASESRLIIGPWGHARDLDIPGFSGEEPYRRSSLAPSIPFFDRILKYQGGDSLQIPKVRLFVMGSNEWRDEKEWPLSRTKYTPYYLTAENGRRMLRTDSNELQPGVGLIRYDPRDPVPTRGGAMLGFRSGFQEQADPGIREDILTFETERFTSELELVGPVKAVLHVSTDVISTDFTVKLVDIHENGTAYNITDGILRRSYGDSQNPEDEESVYRVEIELLPTAIVIGGGHKLRVDVSSSNFPRFNINQNTGSLDPEEDGFVIANSKVYYGQKTPSLILLPVIPQDHAR